MEDRFIHSGDKPWREEYGATFAWIPLDMLVIDRARLPYQRPLDLSRVRKIVAEFDPLKLTPLEVSLRSDGTHAVPDGQHRVAALRQMGWEEAPCMIRRGLTLEQEADLFGRQADMRVSPNECERYSSALVAGNKTAIQAYEVALAAGYQVHDGERRQRSARLLRCPETIMKVIATYGEKVVTEALAQAAPHWDEHGIAPSGATIRGLSAFVAKAQQKNLYEPTRLMTALAELDPATISLKSFEPGTDGRSASQRVFERVCKVYDKGRRTHRVGVDDE